MFMPLSPNIVITYNRKKDDALKLGR